MFFFLDINYVFCQYYNAIDKSLSKISEYINYECIFWSMYIVEGEQKKKYTNGFKSGGNILDHSASKC